MKTGPRGLAESGDPLSHRIALFVATAACLFLIAVQLGWVSPFEYAWGFTLWQYLPPVGSFVLALLLAVLCWPATRARLLLGLAELHGRLAPLRALRWLGMIALPALLWIVRERIYLGDSKILLFALASRDTLFYFPDVGATFLMKSAFDLGRVVGWGGVPALQALICLAAVPALFAFAHVARYLTPNAAWRAFALSLLVLGGVSRIYAGHVEVYSVVLIGLGLYFWASLAHLRGRCGWMLPCLALGIGLWIHLCFLFLIPSLLLLPMMTEPARPLRSRLVQWSTGLTVAAAPMVVFLLLLVVLGLGEDVWLAWAKLVNWSEVEATGRQHYETVWIQLPWEAESGTKYSLYSRLHLKYLGNSFFLLAPSAVPVVLAYAVFATRRLWSTPEAAFLSTASLAMLLYASIVRPVFGPYEWDLFTVTAVCLAALAGHLLASSTPSSALVHLCLLLTGATLLLVAVPWIAVGARAHRDAGPFAIDALHASPDGSFYDDFVRRLEPWL